MTPVAVSLAAVVAALGVVGAVALLVPAGGPAGSGARLLGGLTRRRPGPSVVLALAGAAVALLLTVDGRRAVVVGVGVGCAAAAASLVRRARRARIAERRRAQVVEVCETLVGELRSGQPLLAGLERCREAWPAFSSVVAAARLGADVPTALRRRAELPGAEGLREVASAWQVAERSGSGLALALARVAETARERERTRHLVQAELSSAQATARLVAVLPLVSLAMSAGIGGHPWRFLLDTPAGLACLAGGAVCAYLGLLWIDLIAVSVLRP